MFEENGKGLRKKKDLKSGKAEGKQVRAGCGGGMSNGGEIKQGVWRA